MQPTPTVLHLNSINALDNDLHVQVMAKRQDYTLHKKDHPHMRFSAILLSSDLCLYLNAGMVLLDQKFGGGAKNSSEDFNTCGRTIKTGLIAVDIVSHWDMGSYTSAELQPGLSAWSVRTLLV